MKQLALVILAAGLAAGCAQVGPDEIGVRTVNLGARKGIVPKDYGPGFYRFLWPLDAWHRFPSVIERVSVGAGPARPGQQEPSLQVTSADGDRVAVNAEVFFRVAEGQAHLVLQESGSGERYRAVVESLSHDVVRAVLGRLGTEQFYSEEARQRARSEGMELLGARLDQRGFELVDLLLSPIEFEPGYENLIKEKKLADQRVELEQAKARAAAEQGKVARIEAETEARVQKVQRESQAEVLRIETENALAIQALQTEADQHANRRRADADLYYVQKQAEGQRLVGQAEAEGTRALTRALSGAGSENLVALEALEKLNLVDVSFPSAGFEWFNPLGMAQTIGARGQSGDAESAAGEPPADSAHPEKPR